MLLTLLAFAQPFALHAMSECCVAIDHPGISQGVHSLRTRGWKYPTLVMLLLDQIKPIEQLVPVS